MTFLASDTSSHAPDPPVLWRPPRPAAVTSTPYDWASPPPSQFLEYWQVIRGNLVLICILALAGAGVGWIVSMFRPSMYQARTVLDIRSLNEDFLNPREGTPIGTSSMDLPESYLQTEIKILQSDSIRKRALEQLLRDSPFAGKGKMGAAPEDWAPLAFLNGGPMSFERLVADAGRRVKVRAIGNTRIVDVLCDARDAQVAADVCNVIARTYIQNNIEARSLNTKETGDWLSSQLDDVRRRLTKAEEELKDAARQSSAALDADAETLVQEKLREVQNELSQAEAERIRRESEYEIVARSPQGPWPAEFDSGPIRDYRLNITELKRKVAELSATMTPAHYMIRELNNEIAELESALRAEQTGLVSRLRAAYETAKRREAMLQGLYDEQASQVIQRGDKAVQYNLLKHQVDSEQKLYDTLLQKVQEVGLAAAMRASTISVVDSAVAPVKPYSPNMLMSVGLGLFAGACLGLAFSFLRLRLDRTLQNPGDVALHLQLRELGAIPAVSLSGLRRAMGIGWPQPLLSVRRPGLKRSLIPIDQTDKGTEGRALLHNSIELGTWFRKPPELAEAFVSAMNSLVFASGGGKRSRVIVVTSPEAGDGKTTAATNMAVALAQIGRRVVLVDGDLRKPRLSSIFGLDSDNGLLALLDEEKLEERPLAEFVQATPVNNLYVLPTKPSRERVSAKLHSGRMRALLARLRTEFDVVVIDSPPMLHISDARVLGWLADGVLLVFRSRKTTRSSAFAAAQCLTQDGICVLGTILNDWNPRKARYGGYAGYVSVAS